MAGRFVFNRLRATTNFKFFASISSSHYHAYHKYQWQHYSSKKYLVPFVFLTAVSSLFISKHPLSHATNCESSDDIPSFVPFDQFHPTLPFFEEEEISKHNNKGNRIWVIYKKGVYDITDFISKHPGGEERIMLAAGSSVEPYWHVFPQHNKSEVWEILEPMRIGNYKGEHRAKHITDVDKDYANEPERSVLLKVHSLRPYNAETPNALLVDNFLTPNEIFFVRNHFAVPNIADIDSSIELLAERGGDHSIDGNSTTRQTREMREKESRESGKEGKEDKWTLISKLSRSKIFESYPNHSIIATIQCAGNRRFSMHQYRNVSGIMWNDGAIGTALWEGVLVSDVLKNFGYDYYSLRKEGYRHIHFFGADCDGMTGTHYTASVPIEYIYRTPMMLCNKMNHEPLPIDHGGPIRVLIPGVVGARSVKWLTKIVLSKEESDSFWQKKDYRILFDEEMDWATAQPIMELPIQAVITQYKAILPSPAPLAPPLPTKSNNSSNTATVDVVPLLPKELYLKGYAVSSMRTIQRLEISANDGRSWVPVSFKTSTDYLEELDEEDTEGVMISSDSYSWVTFEYILPLDQEIASHPTIEIRLRAIDSSGNVQNCEPMALWNSRGCLFSSQPRVSIKSH